MILPHTYAAALLLTVLSMICWGSWANTFKLARKWRFELFYYDYSLGLLLACGVAALTLGSLGFDGFLFLDDLMHARRSAMAYGFAGGVVFNLANMLLVAAISVAGLAVAFPVGCGIALVVAVSWNYLVNPQANATLLFAGVAIVVGAIIVDALAYRARAIAELESRIVAGHTKSTAQKVPWKGVILSVASGVLMGSFFPLVDAAREGELGLGPYAIAFVFAAGAFSSTFAFNLFFMNLPVAGQPVELMEYFRGRPVNHLLGIAGGLIWAAGTISSLVVASAPPEVLVGPAVRYAMGQGAIIISALWGILVWKEFQGTGARVKILLTVMLLLLLLGLSLVSIAPLYVGQ